MGLDGTIMPMGVEGTMPLMCRDHGPLVAVDNDGGGHVDTKGLSTLSASMPLVPLSEELVTAYEGVRSEACTLNVLAHDSAQVESMTAIMPWRSA